MLMDSEHPQPETFAGDGFRITLNKRGEDAHVKQRRPVKYGLYSEIETDSALLQFNLNSEVVRAEGRDPDWPSDLEYLKRTAGNDWVYYSTGGYAGSWETLTDASFPAQVSFRIPEPYSEVFKTVGEYYLPNLPYDSNNILGGDPFTNPAVWRLATGWFDELDKVRRSADGLPERFQRFLNEAVENTPERLRAKAERLFEACGGRPSVLPPDARHVDYDVIPLNISHGCLHKCGFCAVKNARPFSSLSQADIEERLDQLATLYGRDLANYNAVFLGDHDPMNAAGDLVLFAIQEAKNRLGIDRAYMRGANVFLFASVTSFLKKDDRFFEKLGACGANVFINVGLESADQETLDSIGKPLRSEDVVRCFQRMRAVNHKHGGIECSANFVFDEQLPSGHIPAFLDLAGEGGPGGTVPVYMSPLCFTEPSARTLFEFKRLKTFSRHPVHLYIIQRI
ncbi:radical SAM protein [Desulfohalovibrio reitneri]|uniref:radical SAM protein n=1 Tax=Desulfohalovibrio reitneri TaxID=1307759 RepID=UPI0004A6FD51|nr:radical SAM protein [Desulfohalovibrio reitneri]